MRHGGSTEARSCNLAERKESGSRRATLCRIMDHDDINPPQYGVSQVVGYIRGKRGMRQARVYGDSIML